MSRLLDWRFTLPRLAAAVVLMMAAQLVVARVVRWNLIRSGERSVGAKVDVGDTRVSLFGGQVTLRDICVANPQSPLRNLLQADRCVVQFKPAAHLHKRTVIERGRVDGLRFGTDRQTSGALAGTAADDVVPPLGWLDEHAAAQTRDWLDRLQHQFQRDLIDQLESVRLTEDLLDRWPEQHSALAGRVRQLKQRMTDFQTHARRAQANPLRHVEFLERMPDEIARLRADVTMLSREVQDLPSVTDADRRAIVAARTHDERFLREQLQFDRIDPNVLTAYLLQQQLSGPVSDLVGWLRWIRRMVPAEAPPVAAMPSRRGQDVNFRGCQRVPDLLIRSLDVQGTARFGGQSIELVGRLNDLANEPALHDQPLRLRLTTRGGPLPLELQATIDRTGPVARDQLLVDCGGIVLPKLLLGGSDKLRLSLAPTTATLSISITLEGDRLSGDVQLVQKQVQIEPEVDAELDRVGVAAALEESLRDVRSLATRVALGGTLDEPRWQLWSNLGPAVAEATDRALERTASVHARQTLAQSQQRVNERLAQLDRQIAEQQAGLAPQLTGSGDTLERVAGGRDFDGRLSFEHLGRRLPADSLFR